MNAFKCSNIENENVVVDSITGASYTIKRDEAVEDEIFYTEPRNVIIFNTHNDIFQCLHKHTFYSTLFNTPDAQLYYNNDADTIITEQERRYEQFINSRELIRNYDVENFENYSLLQRIYMYTHHGTTTTDLNFIKEVYNHIRNKSLVIMMLNSEIRINFLKTLSIEEKIHLFKPRQNQARIQVMKVFIESITYHLTKDSLKLLLVDNLNSFKFHNEGVKNLQGLHYRTRQETVHSLVPMERSECVNLQTPEMLIPTITPTSINEFVEAVGEEHRLKYQYYFVGDNNRRVVVAPDKYDISKLNDDIPYLSIKFERCANIDGEPTVRIGNDTLELFMLLTDLLISDNIPKCTIIIRPINHNYRSHLETIIRKLSYANNIVFRNLNNYNFGAMLLTDFNVMVIDCFNVHFGKVKTFTDLLHESKLCRFDAIEYVNSNKFYKTKRLVYSGHLLFDDFFFKQLNFYDVEELVINKSGVLNVIIPEFSKLKLFESQLSEQISVVVKNNANVIIGGCSGKISVFGGETVKLMLINRNNTNVSGVKSLVLEGVCTSVNVFNVNVITNNCDFKIVQFKQPQIPLIDDYMFKICVNDNSYTFENIQMFIDFYKQMSINNYYNLLKPIIIDTKTDNFNGILFTQYPVHTQLILNGFKNLNIVDNKLLNAVFRDCTNLKIERFKKVMCFKSRVINISGCEKVLCDNNDFIGSDNDKIVLLSHQNEYNHEFKNNDELSQYVSFNGKINCDDRNYNFKNSGNHNFEITGNDNDIGVINSNNIKKIKVKFCREVNLSFVDDCDVDIKNSRETIISCTKKLKLSSDSIIVNLSKVNECNCMLKTGSKIIHPKSNNYTFTFV